MKYIFTLISLFTINTLVFSQTVLLDEAFSNGLPNSWSTIDSDGFMPANADYTDAWISYESVFDTCVSSTSYYVDVNGNDDTSATSSDYLITPKVSLLTYGNIVSWDAKSLDGSYPDGYEVLISTTDSLESSFSTVIKTVTSESPYWTSYSVDLATLGYNTQDVFIAFKNNTTNGFVLLLDNIKITGDDPASIQETEVVVRLFPNPVSNDFTISAIGFKSVILYNVSGEVVLSSNNLLNSISHLPNGLYIAQIQTEFGYVQRKIMKK